MAKSKKSRQIREKYVNGVHINSEFIPADIQWDIDDYCDPLPEKSLKSGTQKPKKKKKAHAKPAKSARKVICWLKNIRQKISENTGKP